MQSRIQGFGSSANPGDSRKSSASSSYAAPPVGGGSAGGSMSLKGFGSANKDGLWKSANGAAGNSGHQSSGGTLSPKALASLARTFSGSLVGRGKADAGATLFGEVRSPHVLGWMKLY